MVTSNVLAKSRLFSASRFLYTSRRLLKQRLLCVQFSNVVRDHKTPTYLIADAEKLLKQQDFSIANLTDNALAFCHIPLVWIQHFLRCQNGRESNQFKKPDFDDEIDVKLLLEGARSTINVFDLSVEERSAMFENYRKNIEIALKESILTPNDVSRILWRLNAFNFQCKEDNDWVFDDTFLLFLANFALERLETLTIRNYEMIINSVVKLKDQRCPEQLNVDSFAKFQDNVFESIRWYYDSLFVHEPFDSFSDSLRKKFIPAFARTFAFLIQNLRIDVSRMKRDDANLVFKRIRHEFDMVFGPSSERVGLGEKFERAYYLHNCSSILLGLSSEFLAECSVDAEQFAQMLLWKLINILKIDSSNKTVYGAVAINCLCVYLRFEPHLDAMQAETFQTFYKTKFLPRIKRHLASVNVLERNKLKYGILNRIQMAKKSDDRYQIESTLNDLLRMIESL